MASTVWARWLSSAAFLGACGVLSDGLAPGDASVIRTDGASGCAFGTVDLDGDPQNGCECVISSNTDWCDGVDNDCNVSTSDGAGDPTLGVPCDGSDTDLCSSGTRRCVGGAPVCEGDQGHSEDCAASGDEDCDGTFDEGCSCFGEPRTCGIDEGACERGQQACLGGSWQACDGVGPSAEICNSQDDDCDGHTDENLTFECFLDNDHDGVPGPDAAGVCRPSSGCPTNYRPGAGQRDCQPDNGNVYPGASEVCNQVDDDCEGGVDEGFVQCYPDGDYDQFAAAGATPAECAVSCRGGLTPRAPTGPGTIDCEPSIATAHPNAAELCNQVDDDCDSRTDETLAAACWVDGDRDGYAPAGAAGTCMQGSTCATGTTNRNPTGNNIDCNDGSAAFAPNVDETCDDGMSHDCDAVVPMYCYPDADGDGYFAAGATPDSCHDGACPGGQVRLPGDCEEWNAARNPGASDDTCDQINQDCDATTDEGYVRLDEVCGDDVDQDCDQRIDENCSGGMMASP